LHIAGQSVLLVHHRRSVAAAIEKKGVSIREPSGKIVRSHIKVRTRLSLDDRPELVLVTVKAYDTEEVGSLLVKSVGRNVPVLTLQNGLGNVDALERHLGSGSIMSGGPGRVIHTGSGTTWLGEINGEISRRCLVIGRVFRAAGFATAVTSNVKGVIWSKAIVNSAINPISSITRLRNGDLLKSPELREIAFKVINEGSGVARANGILLKPSPKGLLARVLALTSNNESSMLQDLEAGRRTEIGHITIGKSRRNSNTTERSADKAGALSGTSREEFVIFASSKRSIKLAGLVWSVKMGIRRGRELRGSGRSESGAFRFPG
jgi:2-dehydropantoate 2-reductase